MVEPAARRLRGGAGGPSEEGEGSGERAGRLEGATGEGGEARTATNANGFAVCPQSSFGALYCEQERAERRIAGTGAIYDAGGGEGNEARGGDSAKTA